MALTSDLVLAGNTIGNQATNSNSYKVYYPTENKWESGYAAGNVATGSLPSTTGVNTQVITPSVMGNSSRTSYELIDEDETSGEEFKRTRMPKSVSNPDKVFSSTSATAWNDSSKRNEMLNENRTLIQNGASFPYYIEPSSNNLTAKYDYKIMPGDPRYPRMVKLEDKLQEARSSFGIQVHGNNDIARAVKYNLYNRYKSPDQNLVFSRMTTHVFFTRPDLNLLNCSDGVLYGANSQVKNHSDTSLLYKINPYIFRLLTDNTRCGDSNNFNMLLSNQIGSFDIVDEELNATEVGKTWGGHSMFYGDGYSGRSAGEISCSFSELQDLSVMKMMKLWITYIDNVSKGAWSPSYDLHGSGVKRKYGHYSSSLPNAGSFGTSKSDSYVYTKTLDYAASIYVFKCGPDGSDVLYWTKYYGVFPVTTGSSALSWDGSPIGSESPKLNIRFKYCYKRDLSPISLIEFNEQSGISKMDLNVVAESIFNPSFNHTSRPYVGAPFIELSIPSGADPIIGANTDMFGKPRTHIRLKFLKNDDNRLTDQLLYRSIHSSTKQNESINGNEVLLC